MKKSTVLAALFAAVLMTSCGGATGPANKVLDKKVYAELAGKYKSIDDFQNGTARVCADIRKYGIIDRKGNEVVTSNVRYIEEQSEGLFIANNDNEKYGVYNSKGKLIVPFEYDFAASSSCGLIRVAKNKNYGYIDAKGKEVIALQYSDAEDFSEGLALVEMKSGYGYINTKGELATAAKYDDAYPFSDGLAIVGLDGDYSVIDKNGETVYSFAQSIIPGEQYHNGLLLVSKNGNKCGYYDKKGQEAIPFQYDYADGFRDGKALVMNKSGKDYSINYIDKTGKIVETVASIEDLEDYECVDDMFYGAFDMISDLLDDLFDALLDDEDDDDESNSDDDW